MPSFFIYTFCNTIFLLFYYVINSVYTKPLTTVRIILLDYDWIHQGELADLTPALAVVEAHGVGYALNISLNTYSVIQGKTAVKLYVHEAIMTGGRDDNYTLYGFANKQERSLYSTIDYRFGGRC